MSFKVTVQSSGTSFDADENEPILEAALRQGLSFPYSCRGGSCGSCRGKVLQGEVEYLDGVPPGISRQEVQEGFALFCQASATTDLVIDVAEINAARDIAVKTLPCRVERMERLCHDVMRLYLKLPAGERLQFLAGQYLDILLKDGRHRSFSMANAPHDDTFIELHIRHVPGGDFSDHVFTGMQEKELLRFRGPLGTFTLREDSQRPVILMAGGTGFAPIKGILEHAFAKDIQRPLHLYWGARAKQDLYLDQLPRNWQREHANFRYTPVLSDPLPGDHWTGRTGYVHEAIIADYPDLSAYEIYAGGPPPMISAGAEAFVQHGLARDCYFSDAFEFAKD